MSTAKAPVVDVSVSGDGPGTSVFLFTLHTDAARSWVDDNVPLESWQWLGAASFGVEHRFADQLASGMMADGLVVV